MRKRIAAAAVLLLAGAWSLSAQQSEAVLKLKNQIIDLQNKSNLAFKDVTLCARVLGFGSYVPLEQPAVPQGSELLLYYEPVNVFTNRVQGQYEIWYTQDIVLLSASGEVLYEQNELLTFHYLSRSPVFDVYATNSLELGNLPAGKYLYKIVVHDKLKEAAAEFSLAFQVGQ